MSRIDQKEEQRRDFYLYIDEFHDLITPSFNTILSQARKYHLNMIFANQYLDQLRSSEKSDSVIKAIFGNVGTIICFQTSMEDAEILAKELPPVPAESFVKLNQGQTYTKLYVQGDNLDAIFLSTLPPLYEEFRSTS